MKWKVLLFIPLIFLLSGCYNYRDLNDLAIVSGISIAKVQEGYEVSLLVINPKKQTDSSGSEEPDFIIYKGTDSSIGEAIRKITLESPKQLYLAHMNLLIIDENVAKNNLKNVLDFFARNPEIRDEFYVMIGKNRDILSVTTPLENISSENILDTLKVNANYLGYTTMITFQDLLHHYLNPHLELAISSVEIYGNQEKGNTTDNIKNTERDAYSIVSGIAIFKDNKLVGYLNDNDALVYNIITHHTNNFLVKTHYSNKEFFVVEVLNEDTDVNVDVLNHKIYIHLKGRAILSEENITNKLDKNEIIDSFQDNMNRTIEDMVLDSVSGTIKKYHTDIYGFQNIVYQKNPRYIKNLKENWNDNVLDHFTIEVTSSIRIVEKGNLSGGIVHESK